MVTGSIPLRPWLFVLCVKTLLNSYDLGGGGWVGRFGLVTSGVGRGAALVRGARFEGVARRWMRWGWRTVKRRERRGLGVGAGGLEASQSRQGCRRSQGEGA